MPKKPTYILILLLALCLLSGCQTVQIMKKFNSGKPVFHADRCIVPFALDGHKITVKVNIDGGQEDFNFVLDTGALTMLNETVAEKLGLENLGEMPTPDKSKHVYLTNLKSLRLGDMAVENFTVPVMKMQSDFKIDAVDGFIGSDFLRFFNIKIDYKNKEITLSKDAEAFDSTTEGYEYDIEIPFPMRFPKLEMVLNDHIKTEGMIDTGSPYLLVMPTSFLKKFAENDKENMIKSKGLFYTWPFTSPECNYILRLHSIAFGNLEIKNIPVIVADLPGSVSEPLLGKSFLDKFVFSINYPEEKLILQPEINFEFTNNIFSAGLALKKESDKTIVKGIWEGLAADKEGIIVGDEVLSINNKNCSEMVMKEINELLNNDDIKTIKFTLKENAKNKDIILQKETLFPVVDN